MGPIAQSVEQRTFNPWVDGSSPSGPTKIRNCRLTQREGPIPGKFVWKYQLSASVKTNPRVYGASYECWSEIFAEANHIIVHISGFCNLIYIRGDLENNFRVLDIVNEETDTNEKVLEFAKLHCLVGVKPSWISALHLTFKIDTVRV